MVCAAVAVVVFVVLLWRKKPNNATPDNMTPHNPPVIQNPAYDAAGTATDLVPGQNAYEASPALPPGTSDPVYSSYTAPNSNSDNDPGYSGYTASNPNSDPNHQTPERTASDYTGFAESSSRV